LKEVGFDFLMDWPADDQPLWMKTRSGPIMSVPYPIEINDSPQILVRHHSPEEFRDFIMVNSRNCCASRQNSRWYAASHYTR
jgi:allantoinase